MQKHTEGTKTFSGPARNGGGGLESAVIARYRDGAAEVEPALCCPTAGYDPRYLDIIPQEILDKDYGCGDPSQYVKEGEVVLDLGSGGGKICYILAQKTGPEGRVIGLDFNDAMLDLARKYEDQVADGLGYRNFAFHKARIQDMALDLDAANAWLRENPIHDIDGMTRYNEYCGWLRREKPLVESDSVDVIVSNCVLNLVQTGEKEQLFSEMFRVLRRGGRAVISDIVCDEDPTPEILHDPHLWSGCIAGAFREDDFLRRFENAGFHGVEILSRSEKPWQTIDGIEFRSMTVQAFKGKQGPCFDCNQAVVYKGPWKQVRDDDGHVYHRGQRMAVCEKTYRLLTDPAGPYAGHMIGVEPLQEVAPEDAKLFDCAAGAMRHPRQTKGQDYRATETNTDPDCSDGACC